jgi:hypothetical protein
VRLKSITLAEWRELNRCAVNLKSRLENRLNKTKRDLYRRMPYVPPEDRGDDDTWAKERNHRVDNDPEVIRLDRAWRRARRRAWRRGDVLRSLEAHHLKQVEHLPNNVVKLRASIVQSLPSLGI